MELSIFSVQDHCPDRPHSLPRFYADVIAQAYHVGALGYDTFWVAGHHFYEHGVVPNPAVFLSHLAVQTQRLRLGTAISILTFHHPATVTEDHAMVGALFGGRLSLGMGSGYLKHEFEGYDVNPAIKRKRFDEALMLVERLLAGERVHHTGQFHTLCDVRLNVLPVQARVPIHVAVLWREAAYHIGRQGRRMLSMPHASVESFEDIRTLMDEYRRDLAEVGIADTRGMAAVALHTHVGPTEAAVRATAADAPDLYVATRLHACRQTYDDVFVSDLSLFGTPDAMAEKLAQLSGMGVDHVMTLHNFGLMSQSTVLKLMRALVEDALPHAGITALAV